MYTLNEKEEKFMNVVKIKIDKDLFTKLKERSEEVGYSSVDEFITHILETEVSKSGISDSPDEIKERLKGLGYIS